MEAMSKEAQEILGAGRYRRPTLIRPQELNPRLEELLVSKEIKLTLLQKIKKVLLWLA